MWPLTAPSRVCPELCSSSHPRTAPHRTAAAQAHGRGSRRRPHRYLGLNPSPYCDSGVLGPSTSTQTPKSAPQRLGQAVRLWEASASVGSGSLPQSEGTETEALARGLSSLGLSDDQWRQSHRAATQILQAIDDCTAASPLGRLFACSTPKGGAVSAGPAELRRSIAVSALLLPSLTLQWLSVSDLDGWLDRGAAHLLREALLVQKAANDASASVNELVGWCLDNCSGPASALAALWGQQQAQALPPRCRSFYSLLLQRLNVGDSCRRGRGQQAAGCSSDSISRGGNYDGGCACGSGEAGSSDGGTLSSGGRGMVAQLAVLCGSVTRTAIQPPSRGRATEQQQNGSSGNTSRSNRGSGSSSGSGNGGHFDDDEDAEESEDRVGKGGARADVDTAGQGTGGRGPGPTASDRDVVVVAGLSAAAAAAQANGSAWQHRSRGPHGTGPRQEGLQVNGPDCGSSSGTWDTGGEGADSGEGQSRQHNGQPGLDGTAGGSTDGGGGGSSGSSSDGCAGGADERKGAGRRGGLFGSAPQHAAGPEGADAGMGRATPLGSLDELVRGSGAGVSAQLGASGGGSTRPTASLLQRPSRGVVQEPESGEYSDEEDLGRGLAGGPIVPSGVETSPLLSAAADVVAAEASLGPGGASAAGMGSLAADSASGFLATGTSGVLRGQQYFPVRLVPTGRFALRDLMGEPLTSGLAIPETGPIVVSNDPRVFPGTEAVIQDYVTPAGDKLAIRLEYIVDRSAYDEVTLQVFNISRVVRKRTQNCLMYVNGKPVNVGDPGVVLAPGDEVWFGRRDFAFRVEVLRSPPSPVLEALGRFCRRPSMAAVMDVDASVDNGVSFANSIGRQDAPAAASGLGALASGNDGHGDGDVKADMDGVDVDMAALSNMSRRDPRRAEALLCRLATRNPKDAAVWLIWAQMAARVEAPGKQSKARLLFRAAVTAARQMDVIPPPPAALEVARRNAMASSRLGRRGQSSSGFSFTSSTEEDDGFEGNGDEQHQQGGLYGLPSPSSKASMLPTPSRARRHNWLLVQALGNWGKHEWRLRMYGSARHLFRAAIDQAARHPEGIAGGGGAAIMHYWASRELEASNVRNARIVAAEALRKCPADVALYVLAASVELEGGNLELAKSYCQRAYSLDRAGKQLFLVWPRVEAALGDRLKARLLYERALDIHPLNTKIMNLYARFEAEEGSYGEAAELYDRALRIDPLSPVMGVHNRADWASLEADLGNTPLARALLEGGLAAHPQSTPLLVTLAKVERLEGRYQEALRLVRAAQQLAGPFNTAVMTERAQVLRALGEREMAANLTRHVAAVRDLNRMKHQGYWGSEAWRAFIEGTRSPEQQAIVVAARARRLELGWTTATRGSKPQPSGVAGQGRKLAAPEAQQWMQLEQLRQRRADVRRLAAQRAARVQAEEDAEEGVGAGVEAGQQLPPPALQQRRVQLQTGSGSSGEDDYYEDEAAVNVPSLDSVRRPMPGDEDRYDMAGT